MKPTDVLEQEHRVIEMVLSCLEKVAKDAKVKRRVDEKSAADAIEFFKGFADRCHHGKEEDLLFPALVECGMSNDHGPIAVMNHEHVDGRALTTRFREAARDQNESEVVAAARAYTFLLREHVEKEEHILFEIARQILPPGVADWLVSSFARVEREVLGEHAHRKYADLARQLCAEAGVPFDPSRQPDSDRALVGMPVPYRAPPCHADEV